MVTAIIFGAFTAFLTDYWLLRAGVQDKARLVIAIVVGVILDLMVFLGRQAAF